MTGGPHRVAVCCYALGAKQQKIAAANKAVNVCFVTLLNYNFSSFYRKKPRKKGNSSRRVKSSIGCYWMGKSAKVVNDIYWKPIYKQKDNA